LSRRRPIRRLAQLAERGLAPESDPALEAVAARFAVSLTEEIVELIDPAAGPEDPIAAQFLPDPRELELRPEELVDPIGDDPHTPVVGVTHRYPDRALLKPVHVCPVYCRFCFRREVVGPGPDKAHALSPGQLEAALDYIRAHDEIWELILTGGDPLVLPAPRLGHLLRALEAIEHVRVIRIHTRVPAVDSQRIDDALIDALALASKPVYVVLHTNHPRELDASTARACARLVDAGHPMLSQTVLLRGVNDRPEILEQLFRRLVELRVKPYYLHHADLARGTSHFRTSLDAGQAILRELRGRVSGLCQPSYVLDLPGGHGKVPVGPRYLGEADEDGARIVEAPDGSRQRYPPEP
jgi:lysine 2,3-aminomutase